MNASEINSHFPFFSVLNEEQVKLLSSTVTEINYKNGETICKQGAYTSHTILLVKGRVKLVHESRVKNLIMKIAQSGEIIELPSLFEDSIFKYSVVAIESCIIWLVDKNTINTLLMGNNQFSMEILKIINRYKFEIIDRFTCLNQKQAHGRIADIILYLSEKVYKKQQFDLTLSRKDLAELTGMSTETVVRILKEFKSDGLLKMSGKSIEINSYNLIKKLSEVG